jgi:general secretion pathway protein C
MTSRSSPGARIAYLLAALALCLSAGLVITGIERLLAAARPTLEREPSAARSPELATETPFAEELGRRILARNMFDSRTGPLTWAESSTAMPPQVAARPPDAAATARSRCEGDLRLLGTIVVHRAPERSLVAVRAGKATHILRVGESAGGIRLLAMGPTLAYLATPGTTACTLPLLLSQAERSELARRSAAPLKPANKAKAPRRRRAKSLFSEQELVAAIRGEGEGRFVVARPFLEGALGKEMTSRPSGRFVPAVVQGRRLGMKVYGIRRSSLLSHLGLRNGDIVRSLNGLDVTSADGLLSAYALVRERDSFTLALQRAGKPQVLEYRLE